MKIHKLFSALLLLVLPVLLMIAGFPAGAEASELCLTDSNAVPVLIEVSAEEIATLETGDTISVLDLLAEDESYGIASLTLDWADTPVQMTLYGDAAVTNTATAVTGDPVLLDVSNIAGYPINLREGPGTNFRIVGTMAQSDVLTTDGRSADSQWFRLQTPDGIAWAHASLIQPDGDTEQLSVLDNPFVEPLQSFILQTNWDPACAVVSSGLLLQATGDSEVNLNINEAGLSFSNAIVLVQVAEDSLEVQVIQGEATVSGNGGHADIVAGQGATVPLDAETQTVAGVPRVLPMYSFAAVGGAPLGTLLADASDDNAICIAGVGIGEESATLYGGPGDGYAAVRNLSDGEHREITGAYTDASQIGWWRLGEGLNQAWVTQENVRTVGLCGNNIVQAAPPQRGAPISVAGSTLEDLLADGTTVWQAESGPDIMTGDCSSPQLAICSHPSAITKNADGSILWRGQEPVPFALANTGPNSWYYEGRNFQNNGRAILELVMTSTESYSLTYTTIYDSDPQCNHTFYYTGTPRY